MNDDTTSDDEQEQNCQMCGQGWGLVKEPFALRDGNIDYEVRIVVCQLCRDRLGSPDTIEELFRRARGGDR